MGMNKKVIGLFKDELGGKIMKGVYALRVKIYTYLMDDDSEKKKAKGVKKCIIKRWPMFENYKDSLFNDNTTLRSQLKHIHMEQMGLKYVKVRSYVKYVFKNTSYLQLIND